MFKRTARIVAIAAVVFVTVGIGLAATRPCAAQDVAAAEQGLARALEAQLRHTDELMAIKGVVGTAVGLDPRGQYAVKVYVANAEDAVGLTRQLDGIPVDVRVTGHLTALKRPEGKGPGSNQNVDPTARFDRPVPIGVSTGHPLVTAGTIGCRVTDGIKLYALSNNHVFAVENLGAKGRDSVLQPGVIDGGEVPDDYIGTLSDFEPIVFSLSANNVIDAAIAEVNAADVGNSTPSNGYGIPQSTTATPVVGMKVLKYGRTTSQTEGRIDGINATVNIGYSAGVARFVNQIIISPGGFSAPGDSGSLIVVSDKKGKKAGPDHLKPVGLLFAGSSVVTIANPIEEVLVRLGVQIDGR